MKNYRKTIHSFIYCFIILLIISCDSTNPVHSQVYNNLNLWFTIDDEGGFLIADKFNKIKINLSKEEFQKLTKQENRLFVLFSFFCNRKEGIQTSVSEVFSENEQYFASVRIPSDSYGCGVSLNTTSSQVNFYPILKIPVFQSKKELNMNTASFIISKSDSSRYLYWFEQERKNFPENISVYYQKWLAELKYRHLTFDGLLKELKYLEQNYKGNPTLPFLQFCGYYLLSIKNESEEHNHFKNELAQAMNEMKSFRDVSELNKVEFQNLFTQLFSSHTFSKPKSIDEFILELMKNNPSSIFTMGNLKKGYWRKLTKEEFLNISRSQLKKEKNYRSMKEYSLALSMFDDSLMKALEILKEIESNLADSNYFFKGFDSDHNSTLLPNHLYEIKIAIYEKQKNYSKAIETINTFFANVINPPNEDFFYLQKVQFFEKLNQKDSLLKTLVTGYQLFPDNINFSKLLVEEYKKRTASSETGELDSSDYKKWLGKLIGDNRVIFSKLNMTAPKIKTGDNSTLALVEIKDFVILEFFETTCSPCIANLKNLTKYFKENPQNKKMKVLVISRENKETLSKFLANHKFDYEIVDNPMEIYDYFRVITVPETFIIGKNGTIFRHFSGGSANGTDLIKIIENIQKSGI